MALSEKEEKLKDAADMKKIIKYQQDHYEKVLSHLDEQIAYIDEQIAEHDLEIAALQERKAVVIRHFAEAPEQLIVLARRLKEAEKKEHNLKTDGKDRAKQVTRLKTRIEKLREKLDQMDPDGRSQNQTTS